MWTTRETSHPGGSYTGTLTASVPGVTPGSYYVILRTNILDTLPESTLSNNESASSAETAIDAPALALGISTDGDLSQAQYAYYEVSVTAGQTLEVSLTTPMNSAYNELFVSYGTMPTLQQSEFQSQDLAANQEILVPSTQEGDYYILAYAASTGGGVEPFSLSASVLPFGLLSVNQSAVGNTGSATIDIRGSNLGGATSFVLTGPDNVTLVGQDPLVVNNTNVYVTFDTSNAPLGYYSLSAVDNEDNTATLSDVLQIVQGTTPQVAVYLSLPSAVLPGAVFDAEVVFRNTGNVDTSPPIIELNTNGTALIGMPSGSWSDTTLNLLGRSPDGPGAILRPGESVTITLQAKDLAPAGGSVDLQSSVVAATNDPIDFNSLVAAAGIPSSGFDGESQFLSTLQSFAGSTNDQFLTGLQLVVSSLGGQQSEGVPAIPLMDAWDDELSLVSELSYAESTTTSASSDSIVGTYSLPSGETVQIYTAQEGAPGAPVYYISAGWLSAENYDSTSWVEVLAAAEDYCYEVNNPTGLLPTIKYVTWNSSTIGELLEDNLLYGPLLGTIIDYDDAAANVPAVAQAISNDIVNSGYSPDLVTLVGHSLGGQVSIYAGFDYEELTGQQISTVEALDPAGPGFPVSGLYADAGAAVTVNTINTSCVLGEYANMVGTMGHNYFPVVPADLSIIGDHEYAYLYYIDQLFNGVQDPDPNPDDPQTTCDSPILRGIIDDVTAPVVRPVDPNAIIGPAGFGDADLIAASQELPYEILFENESTATAPAQQVIVTQQLDPNLDWGSFRLGSFGFGGMIFQVPANSAYYQTTINLTQQLGYDVDVTATIDERTGIATWIFTTIDPATGEIPLDPTVGFLPPDNASGAGEGFVSYTVMANQSDPTGTVISAQATVTFDTQPPLNTPQIFNTIDAGTGLSSAVAPLPAYERRTVFNVSWSGTDASDGSAIASYTVYVSEDGGPYTAWLTNTTLTAAPFVGQDGQSYSFYSVAIDNAGNVEPAPTSAQATALVDVTPPTSTVNPLPSETTSTSITVSVTGYDPTSPGGIPSGVASYAIYVSTDGGPFTLFTTVTPVEPVGNVHWPGRQYLRLLQHRDR